MVKKGLHPSNVFHIDIPISEVYKRTADKADTDFDCNRVILTRRLKCNIEHTRQAAFFFHKFYNSVTNICGLKSKWYVCDKAMQTIQRNMTARMNFARDYHHRDSK